MRGYKQVADQHSDTLSPMCIFTQIQEVTQSNFVTMQLFSIAHLNKRTEIKS